MASMARRDIPTVFLHGDAPPADVQYAEHRLCDACGTLPTIRYTVLWIDTSRSIDNAFEAVVEVEIGVADRTVSSRGSGTTVRDAVDDCMDALALSLRPA